MVFLTGDTHGQFQRLQSFYEINPTLTEEDILVILGDASFNYLGDERDNFGKKAVSRLPFQVLCIHGNHEIRPENIEGYALHTWNEGIVYRQPQYPNIFFAKDGEVYNLNGRKTIAIGGAYSVDKHYRLLRGYRWFADEQPSPATKKHVEACCAAENWQVDAVLSHTCPISYLPVEMFLGGIDQSTVDNSTEEWLDQLEKKLSYTKWFCGHYHTDKQIDKIQFLFESIIPWPF